MEQVYSGMRITYQGVRMPTPYNFQIQVGDQGYVQEVRDGQVVVVFDRGVIIPLTSECDVFVGA